MSLSTSSSPNSIVVFSQAFMQNSVAKPNADMYLLRRYFTVWLSFSSIAVQIASQKA